MSMRLGLSSGPFHAPIARPLSSQSESAMAHTSMDSDRLCLVAGAPAYWHCCIRHGPRGATRNGNTQHDPIRMIKDWCLRSCAKWLSLVIWRQPVAVYSQKPHHFARLFSRIRSDWRPDGRNQLLRVLCSLCPNMPALHKPHATSNAPSFNPIGQDLKHHVVEPLNELGFGVMRSNIKITFWTYISIVSIRRPRYLERLIHAQWVKDSKRRAMHSALKNIFWQALY